MKIYNYTFQFVLLLLVLVTFSCSEPFPRMEMDFNLEWKFYLGDDSLASTREFDDSEWRKLDLPHDWSIEGDFSEENDTKRAGGALPAGIGWYRKEFEVPKPLKDQPVYIDFGGVYRNSEVWINGQYLGKRPYGYSSFRYDLTPYLRISPYKNTIAVRVDNSLQPNSRWYTGSGIYRNVKLVTAGHVHVNHWGSYMNTPKISENEATAVLELTLKNASGQGSVAFIETSIQDPDGNEINRVKDNLNITQPVSQLYQQFNIAKPKLWSPKTPNLYKAITEVKVGGELTDQYITTFGIRDFKFDAEKGFFLNGKPIKIYGVNQHHDLGALGAAWNKRAAQRQLEILKEMGVNAIRMAHNPPAAELLDLCDEMGFLVIDESFDAWAKKKAKKDYHLDWEKWHVRDLQDMLLRDRNHPSIIAWSIGNEIREQFDSTGIDITRELAAIVKSLDTTRLVTSGLTENEVGKNFIIESGALDLYGFNYKHEAYKDLPNRFPGQKFLASETGSAYATRGVYNMPSDSTQKWPAKYGVEIPNANPDYTVSAYDMISAYWGSTHEAVWKEVKRLDHMAGIFIWSGFDYIGEPEPYELPARSSYFGVIDLAGFPKDAYYLYQSEWSEDTVLHVFPHWNWETGQTIDVWAYYNYADEVELFLNGDSKGVRSKNDSTLHTMWRLTYVPGEVKVISRKNGVKVAEKVILTAGEPSQIQLSADRSSITPDGYDLSFITVDILDENGLLAPNADNEITFEVTGPARIVGTDNGYQASWESFKSPIRKAWKGKALVILQSKRAERGEVILSAKAEGLVSSVLKIIVE